MKSLYRSSKKSKSQNSARLEAAQRLDVLEERDGYIGLGNQSGSSSAVNERHTRDLVSGVTRRRRYLDFLIQTYYKGKADSMEQRLIEDLIVESIQMFGQDVWYISRSFGALDDLLNEDDLPVYDTAHMLEMYIKNVDGFEGEGDLYSKFGVEIRDSATFVISRRSWERFVSLDTNRISF